MARHKTETEKTEQKVKKETDNPSVESETQNSPIVNVTIPNVPDSIKTAFEQLRDDIVAKHDSQDFVTLVMAVDVRTAKADLIPIPTSNNMLKLKQHLDKFPEAIQDAIKKNIPEPDMKASKEIWDFLKNFDSLEKLLPEKTAEQEQDEKKMSVG